MNRLSLLDKFTGNDYNGYLSLYRKTQWYAEEQMLQFQVEKLKALLNKIRITSPFYGKIINDSINISDIKDLSCLSNFPVLDKQDLKRHYSEILNNDMKRIKSRVSKGWTGGTTGQPLTVYKDHITRSSIWGAYYRFYDWMGISFGHPVLAVWGTPLKAKSLKHKLKHEFSRQLRNVKAIGADEIEKSAVGNIIKLFHGHKPVLLNGYAQAIKDMVLILRETDFSFALKAISTTADTLFDNDRKLFREVFGCETFDQYGCGEVGSIAFECDAHQGLHVVNERCIVETNEQGELIITDLDNYVLPIIRYKNGDIVETDNTPCSCGRYGNKIKKIHGRIRDVIIGSKGSKIHPILFNSILNDSYIGSSRTIKKYKVIQHDRNNIEWLVVCDDLLVKDMEYMKRMVQEQTGIYNVNIKPVKDISSDKNGKYRLVESMLHKDEKR